MQRKNTKRVKARDLYIGGSERVLVQSMTNTKTNDIESTVNQILELKNAGCDIVRLAVLDEACAKSIYQIKSKVDMPLVADIHFDYKLALIAIEQGIDKIRINPGNIGSDERVFKVASLALKNSVPIRIGVNGGSLERDILEKYGMVTPQAMVESAKRHIDLLNKFDFDDIVVSLKASDVNMSIEAYKLFSSLYNYPLHLGITEAGTYFSGTVKSAVGIGALLSQGIGDTIRVSLTADPVSEVLVGKEILKSLSLIKDGVEIISCPTCGRCNIDLISLANEAELRLSNCKKNIKVAIMGCAVNGPGEASACDIGIAAGKGEGLLFKKGVIVKKVSEENLLKELMDEIDKL